MKGEFYKFKRMIKLEPYLTLIHNRKQRISYSKLRLYDHKLDIEILRHQKFKVPRDQRTCSLYFSECEDEIHFLLNCDKLSEQLQSFEQKLVSNILLI